MNTDNETYLEKNFEASSSLNIEHNSLNSNYASNLKNSNANTNDEPKSSGGGGGSSSEMTMVYDCDTMNEALECMEKIVYPKNG